MTDENVAELYGTNNISEPGRVAAQQRLDGFFGGVPTQGAPDVTAGSTLTTIGLAAQITGGFMDAIGGFFAAQAQKDVLKSQALSAEFQASMANLNARQAEIDAQSILAAGRQQVGQLTMQRGQEKSSKKVSAAARGVVGNVGSAAEIMATEDLVKEIDAMTINRNTVRAAGQARMQATNQRNQSLLAGVSAGNLRRTAGSISPAAAFNSASMAGAGRFAASYARSRRST